MGMGSDFGPPPIFMVLFLLVVAIIVGGILINIGKGVSEWTSNNAQPEQADEVVAVSKRTEVSGGEKSTRTEYYVTFELPGGARKELEVSGRDYGQIAEGDRGQLRYQGTRYLGFARLARAMEAPPVASNVPFGLKCDYCGNALPAGKIKCESCGWTWKPVAT